MYLKLWDWQLFYTVTKFNKKIKYRPHQAFDKGWQRFSQQLHANFETVYWCLYIGATLSCKCSWRVFAIKLRATANSMVTYYFPSIALCIASTYNEHRCKSEINVFTVEKWLAWRCAVQKFGHTNRDNTNFAVER